MKLQNDFSINVNTDSDSAEKNTPSATVSIFLNCLDMSVFKGT